MRSSTLVMKALAGTCAVSACAGETLTDDHGRVVRVDDRTGVPTVVFAPGTAPAAAATAGIGARQSALLSVSASSVTVFYPPPGGSTQGLCFVGVFTDAAGNVYPVHAQGM